MTVQAQVIMLTAVASKLEKYSNSPAYERLVSLGELSYHPNLEFKPMPTTSWPQAAARAASMGKLVDWVYGKPQHVLEKIESSTWDSTNERWNWFVVKEQTLYCGFEAYFNGYSYSDGENLYRYTIVK